MKRNAVKPGGGRNGGHPTHALHARVLWNDENFERYKESYRNVPPNWRHGDWTKNHGKQRRDHLWAVGRHP